MQDELGSLVEPPQAGIGWTDYLSNPVNRSALLSFGLQAMTGGWGNGTQQMAAALGAGAQGAAGTAKAMQEQALNTRDFNAKEAEQAANRASHEKISAEGRASREEIARTNAANRMEIEGLRNEARMARIAAIHGPSDEKERALFARTKTDYFKKIATEAGNPTSPFYKMNKEQLDAAAEDYARQTLDKERRNPSFSPPTSFKQPGAESSAKPPNIGNSSVDVGLFPPRIVLGEANVKFNKLKSDPKYGQQFQADLATPEGREKLKLAFPDLRELIDGSK